MTNVLSMRKLQPPFRADQVGSLLRPKELLEKRYQWKKGELPADVLREAENTAIRETVKKIESLGMKAITDGEFRRDYFHLDFLQQLDGVTVTGGIAANPSPIATELSAVVHARGTRAMGPPGREWWWCRAPPAHSAHRARAGPGETACGAPVHHHR